jgi:nitroreductase
MDFFEAVEKRRSIRKFTSEPFPADKIQKAIEAAVLAPNSSNTQTWDFHWVQSDAIKAKVVPLCLNQSAARTASQLVVFVADPTRWKRSQKPLVRWVEQANAPKVVRLYYEKLIPVTYRWGFLHSLAVFKWVMTTSAALFRPMARGPYSRRQIQEVAVKSAALAAENFVLAITAQGGSTCMMEGFDEPRLKRLLGLGPHSRIVMVVGIGYEAERGTWGPRFRLPLDEVLHVH